MTWLSLAAANLRQLRGHVLIGIAERLLDHQRHAEPRGS